MKRAGVVSLIAAGALSACSGGSAGLPPMAGVTNVSSVATQSFEAQSPSGARVVLVPATLAFFETGTAGVQMVTVRESGSAAYRSDAVVTVLRRLLWGLAA